MDMEENQSEEECKEEKEEAEESEEEKRRRRFRKANTFTQEEQHSQHDTLDHKVPDPIDDLLHGDENLDLYQFTQFTQTQSDGCKEGASQREGFGKQNVNNMLSELMASQACWGTQLSEENEDEDESVVPQRPHPFSTNKEIYCKNYFTLIFIYFFYSLSFTFIYLNL